MNSEDRAILEQEDLGDLVSHGAACPKCGAAARNRAETTWCGMPTARW